MNLKPLALIAVLTVAITGLTGCSMAYDNSAAKPEPTANVESSKATLDVLRSADEITLKKAVFSIHDQYTVTADGVNLGKIEGQYFPVFGDTFSFRNADGNLVASEGEKVRFALHGASMYDYNNEKVGELQEELSLIMAKWQILDAEGKSIGEAKQNFNLSMDFGIKNSAGAEQYHVHKKFLNIGGSSVTITRVTSDPSITATQAIWLAAVGNELDEAQSDDSSRERGRSSKH